MPDPKPDLTADELKKLKRDELDKVAAQAGVPNPEDLANKEEVIEAIEEPNPALVQPEVIPDPVPPPMPDPEPAPGERAYLVTGPHIVHGHQPGSKFAATIPAVSEALLIESGHIKRLNS